MNKEIMTPKIRFVMFNDNWRQCKLDTIFGNIRNAFVGTATPYYVEKGHFYLESNNIKNGQINRNTEVFINDEFHMKQKDNWLHTGDLVMVQSGHVGHTAVIPEELNGSAAHALIMFSDYKENANPYFLNYQFQTMKSKKKLSFITTGNTIKHILSSEMKKYQTNLPTYNEQIKIGNFFKQLDNLITLQQQLLNDHKQLKKAMLQKMFPQKGESVPRIRFAGFTGNWKKHKLGNYLTIPEKNEKKVTNLDELITLKLNLLGMYSGSNRATLELGSTKYYERKAGQFLYGKQNFFNGSMGIIPAELDGKATSGDVPAFDINDINRDYIFTYVSRPSYWKSKESQSSGTGSKRIHEKVLQTFDINVPSSEEQTKIGNFFKQLDETIVLNEKKLETYQNLKKAMLQKMFV